MGSDLYSHPGVPLEEHVNRCLELARFFSKGVNLSEEFEKALLVAVSLHDFGKATSYFQAYIRAITEGKPFKPPYFGRHKLTEHALLSGVYAYFVSKRVLKDGLTPFFVFVACRRHHASLKSFTDEPSGLTEKEDFLREQVKALDEGKVNAFISALDLPESLKNELFFDKEAFLRELPSLLLELERYRRRFRESLRGECRTSFEDYFTFLRLFSLLLDADKTEAGAKPFKPERKEIPPEAVFNYKKRKLKTKRKIDELREQAFREVLSREISLRERIYSLTLPTGMGKTLTGFAFTLRLRKKVYEELGYLPRIIYALPFLSVVDQNAEVLKEVLGSKEGALIVKHHHLSDASYDEFDWGVSRVLTEGWNAEVVVTTFVQLFHAIFAHKNAEARRFNKLAGSIVILDEVQALPTRYWHLVRRALKELSERFGTFVVLMTATQPHLLEEATELSGRDYFSLLDRVEVRIDPEPKTLERFAEELDLSPRRSYLFIANTIASSRRLYELIRERFGEEVCYLSTAVVPYERRKRIEELRRGRYRLAVSTQLVEAGVDLDFDEVFRDLAPLDSLVQSAGRCNRNMEKGKGVFRVVSLTDEEGKPFWRQVYDAILVRETQELLKGRERLSEGEFTRLVEAFFARLWDKVSADESRKIEKAVECLRFDGENSVSEFKLIQDEPYKRDVFVELNEEAREVLNQVRKLVRALKEKRVDPFKAREEFNKLKPRFYDFVVSVDVRKNQPAFDEELNLYLVPNESLELFYDELGFKTKGEDWWGV